MLTKRIIPCLDVRDGRVVKGVQFQNLRDMGDPAELAHAYEAQGADELVVLDVSATVRDDEHGHATVVAVRERLSIPLTVGGGVRKIDDAQALLASGADKVSINTAAVRTPGLVDEMAQRFGGQCTVVAIDAVARSEGRGWIVATHSGGERTELDAVAWAEEVESRGAGEILLTSWNRDGTREGYDLPLLTAVSSAVSIPVIASGGASGPEHLAQAYAAGAEAALAASIFHEGQYTVQSLKTWLAGHGVAVRCAQSVELNER